MECHKTLHFSRSSSKHSTGVTPTSHFFALSASISPPIKSKAWFSRQFPILTVHESRLGESTPLLFHHKALQVISGRIVK
jgi:hypothetical protein